MAAKEPTFGELKDTLKKRCDVAHLECDVLPPFLPDWDAGLRVFIPAGREKRTVVVSDAGEASRLLAVQFEDYRFIGDYDAIAHYKNGAIEAVVKPAERFPMPTSMLSRNIFAGDGSEQEGAPKQEGEPKKPRLHVTRRSQLARESIVLEPPSREVRALIARASRGSGFALRIEGAPLATQDEAIDRLETLGNAFLFQVDLRAGVALLLARSRRMRGRPGVLAGRKRSDAPPWRYPQYVFPREPMELYWYARSARGMPLLEFLAYYQVLEYFFPTYSEQEARLRVRNVLKDPSFNPERESDLTRLLGTVRPTAQGTSGNERSQLKDTVRACVGEDELREALTADEQTREFFSTKQGFIKRTLSLKNPQANIRDEVADRIYEIRCMIVHTKIDGGETQVGLLLPFSREAEQLVTDIGLVRFVAERVLISGGVPLR